MGCRTLDFLSLDYQCYRPLSVRLSFAGFLRTNVSCVCTFIAAVITSVTNFWIFRIWGRKIVAKLAPEKTNLDKIDSLTKDYGLQTLFIFNIYDKEFHDVISYAFGLTNLKFKQYFIINSRRWYLRQLFGI